MSDQRIAPGQSQPQKKQEQKSRPRKSQSQTKNGGKGMPSTKTRVIATVIAIMPAALIAVSGYALWSQGQGVQAGQPAKSQLSEQSDNAAGADQHGERDQGQATDQGDGSHDGSSDEGSRAPQGQASDQSVNGGGLPRKEAHLRVAIRTIGPHRVNRRMDPFSRIRAHVGTIQAIDRRVTLRGRSA